MEKPLREGGHIEQNSDNYPETPVGRKGNPILVRPGSNNPDIIGGIEYSGHALDEMQEEGIFPSVVENAIRNSESETGKREGTLSFYDSENNVTVIISSEGKVITVSRGRIRQEDRSEENA